MTHLAAHIPDADDRPVRGGRGARRTAHAGPLAAGSFSVAAGVGAIAVRTLARQSMPAAVPSPPVPAFLAIAAGILVAAVGLWTGGSSDAIAQTAPTGPRDFVYQLNGTPVAGQLIELNRQGAVLEVRGGRKEVPLDAIERVTFAGEPRGLTQGREMLRSGQIESAVEELQKLKADDFSRPEILEDWKVQLGLGRAELALRGAGDAKAAGRELAEYWKTHPESYYRLAVSRVLGDLSMGIGNFESAVKFYGELTRSPFARFQLQGSLLEAKALQSAGQFDKALQRYQQAQDLAGKNGSGSDPAEEVDRLLAQVGVAACLAESGKAAEAETKLIELIRATDNRHQRLFAAAYNALGAAYRHQQRPTDSLLAYMHVHLLFPQDPSAHAEALYYLKGLWTTLKRPEEASKVDQLLKSRYGNSPWAAKS